MSVSSSPAAPNSEAVIQAWKAHLPCRVRFGAKAQQEGRGPGPAQHTGILFDLQLTKINKYEFKVSGAGGGAAFSIYTHVCGDSVWGLCVRTLCGDSVVTLW